MILIGKGSKPVEISDPVKYPGVKIIQGELSTQLYGSGFYLDGVIHVPVGYPESGIQHEYGHYLHETIFPISYAGVPSASFFNAMLHPSSHYQYWTELIANKFAVAHFGQGSAIAKEYYTFPTKPTKKQS